MMSTATPTRLRRAAALAALALAATGIVALPAGPAQAEPGCLQVNLDVRTWIEHRTGPNAPSGGYLAVYTLTNICDTPVTGWQLDLVLPPGHSVGTTWSSNWTVTGQQATATNQAWNRVLAPGQSTTFGYLGAWAGAYSDPLSCAINGAPCDGGGPAPNEPPVVTLTAPTDGQGLNLACPVFLTADASDPDGSVDRVEFYVDGVLLGSDTTAPYAFEAETGVSGAIEHTAFARAVDDAGASTDSATVDFLRLPPPPSLQLVACNPPGEVAAGTSEEIHYSKTAAGSVPVTLTVTGDPGITVAPTSFTLTTGTHVVVTAAPGSSGSSATITATAPGFGSSTVTVTVP